ncbi:ATP-binding protein (plasmid) [Bacillus cereus]|nr:MULTISPECIES: ATP-binding protein [Bacillus cereus group]MDM8365636.1 ATP-binding protein [Bacillus thuringiensis]UIJ70128.1 ATP-binding protein [Bacillus cereus]
METWQGAGYLPYIYGRTAIVDIDPVFEELAHAFDSSTKTDEERSMQMA